MATIGFTRNYPRIQRFLGKHRSLLILGPRGSGKTHFLSRLVNQHQPHLSIDLLDKVEFERILRRPESLTKEILALLEKSSSPLLVFIDEIQRIPSLLNEVHRLTELHKPKLFFILTGSSARKLKEEKANLLAGRALRESFFPLGIDEFNLEESFEHALQFGCLPQVLSDSDDEFKQAYLKTYVGTYLQEEVQREARVRNMEGFARFLEFAAVENGNIVNYSKVGKAVGIADTTVKAFYQLLIDTLIAYEIPAWTHSLRKQIQTASRYYLFDNGVINALTGELTSELRPATYRYGKLFETFFIHQVIQYLDKNDIPLKLYHYREHSGLEVDLVLQKNPHSPCLAIEIKSNPNPSIKDVQPLNSFKKSHPKATVFTVCQTPRAYVDGGINFVGIKEGLENILEFESKSSGQ